MATRSLFRGGIAISWLIVTATVLAADSRDAWQQPDRVVADMNLRPGAVVADVGAGRGYFTFRLAQAVGPQGKVWATDIDSKALQTIAERSARDAIKNVETVLGEPADTKLAPASVDAVLLCDVLHHVPADTRPALLKSIAQAIKPGGMMYLIDWRVDAAISYDQGRRIPRETLVALMTDAGLVLDAEYYYLVHQVFMRFRKPDQSK